MMFAAEDEVTDWPTPTPLYIATAGESDANLWTSVNGWTAARFYSNVEAEYAALTEGVAVVDLGPFARYAVSGKDAAAFLSRVTTVAAARVGPGEAAAGALCAASGRVVDFVEIARFDEASYLVTLCRPRERRLRLGAEGYDVSIDDASRELAAIGVFGPGARPLLVAAGFGAGAGRAVERRQARGVDVALRPVAVGRARGVELLFTRDEALTVWERLKRAGAPCAAGLDALEALRIEGGMPRLDVDFLSADAAPTTDAARLPVEIGVAGLAPERGGWFSGRAALKKAEARRALRLFVADAASLAPGAQVLADGAEVGRITSSVYSPFFRRAACFADIPAGVQGAKAFAAKGRNMNLQDAARAAGAQVKLRLVTERDFETPPAPEKSPLSRDGSAPRARLEDI